MDVVLINPPSPQMEDDMRAPPIGLMSLASYLEEHHFKVSVLDMGGDADPALLKQLDTKVIGLTLQSVHYPWVYKVIPELRALYPQTLIVIGGHHASALPVETMTELRPDCLVVGEGELALVDVLNSGATGIIYGKQVDVNAAPMPAYHLIDFSRYHRVIEGRKTTTVMSSRGCPFSCVFCAKLPHSRYRYRDPRLVIDDIAFLKHTYGIEAIMFHDDDFTFPAERVITLANGLSGLGIVWRCLSRTTHLDLALLKHMKECGCYEICFGVESGSARILRLLRKQATVEDNKNAILIAKAVGLKVTVYLMMNVPSETEEDLTLTKKLLLETKPDGWMLHTFIPTVGSEMWEGPRKFGFTILSHDFSKYHTIGKHGLGGVVTDSPHKNFEAVREDFLAFLRHRVKNQYV